MREIKFRAWIGTEMINVDIDNITKSVLDACNGIVYVDDKQVVKTIVGKYWSKNPRIEVEIKEVE